MLLAIDAGNTHTVFAVYEGKILKGKWRISSDPKRTEDEYAVLLSSLFSLKGIHLGAVTGAIISTVVPQNLFVLKKFCKDYGRCQPLVVGEASVKFPITIAIPQPEQVGADRLVDATAAYVAYGGNCIVLDFGTATTFNVITDKGVYTGGVIAPGIHLSLDALYKAAARLSEVAVIKPKKVLGNSTETAIQSGIFWGYVGLIEGIVSRLIEEQGQKMKVIATGGLAGLFCDAVNCIDHHEPDLTMMGLHHLYQYNNTL